jgi:hypothetical protein
VNTSERLLRALEKGGLLMLQDPALPSIAALVAGEAITGSWWSHPRSHEIFREVGAIAAHRDVLVCKLLDGKVTFVHRRLWPAVLAVALAREAWQTNGLTSAARELWDQLERDGKVVASGSTVKEIENRLLARGEHVHTKMGKHKIRLECWSDWSRRVGCEAEPDASAARSILEESVLKLEGKIGLLPWHRLVPPAERRAATKSSKTTRRS